LTGIAFILTKMFVKINEGLRQLDMTIF